jgi:hypothetical protein
MGFPWDGAVAGVTSQPNPLVAAATKHSVGFKLGDMGICPEKIDALFFGSFGPTFLAVRRWGVLL